MSTTASATRSVELSSDTDNGHDDEEAAAREMEQNLLQLKLFRSMEEAREYMSYSNASDTDSDSY